ncbi:MAG: TonB-dependent receptor, partial [Caulobacterales bacterium]|nr:TonB-dependent receptor [Caulobacterales bacterium]
LLTRSTEKATERRTNIDDPSTEEGVRDITQWFERQAWTGQVSGSHFFPVLRDASIDWRASHSEALRDAPFQSDVFYRNGLEEGIDSRRDVSIAYELLNDTARDVGVDVEVPLGLGALDAIIKGGWSYRDSERDTVSREYSFEGAFDASARELRVDEFLRTSGLVADLPSNPSDVPESFAGRLELDAFYLGGDVQLGPFIRAQVGFRYEDSLQTADAFTRDIADADVNFITEYANSSEYGLPAGTITWNFGENQQVRLGYSETITRPQFRELAPQIFRNNISDTLSQGNPRLENTEITNYDIRYEWYFGRDEFLTIGAFYKELDKPIVEYTRTAFDSTVSQFVNAPSATVQGVEFEFEKAVSLPSFLDVGILQDKEYFFATNYTFTDSELDNDGFVRTFGSILPPGQSEGVPTCEDSPTGAGSCVVGTFQFTDIPAQNIIDDGTPLQGQSDHLFNLQLGYEDYDARSRARILLNYNSDRILFLRSDDATRPNTVEVPPITLDFRYSRAWDLFNREVEFSFTARNLLDDNFETTRQTDFGELIFDQYELGRSFSVGLTGRF